MDVGDGKSGLSNKNEKYHSDEFVQVCKVLNIDPNVLH